MTKKEEEKQEVVEKEEKGAILRPDFFAHEWEPSEKDDENLPVYERTFRELDWIWDGVLSRGGTSIVSAGPKVGKTTFMTNLAVAHARGDATFLGRRLKQGMVTMIILEGSPDEVIKTIKVLSKGKRLPIWIRTFHSHSPQEAKQELRKIIERDVPSLLIIDTLWKLIRAKDVADYGTMAEGMEIMDHLSREFGTHVMASHHNKKSKKGDIDDVLGSTSIVGGIDTVIQITRTGKMRKLYSTQRHGADIDSIGISLKGKELVLGDLYGDLGQMILVVLSSCQAMTTDEIVKAVGANRNNVVNRLYKMVEENKIKREGGGMKGFPHLYSL